MKRVFVMLLSGFLLVSLSQCTKEGPAGPQGQKGDKGETGNAGPQGPKGDKGEDGNAKVEVYQLQNVTIPAGSPYTKDFTPSSSSFITNFDDLTCLAYFKTPSHSAWFPMPGTNSAGAFFLRPYFWIPMGNTVIEFVLYASKPDNLNASYSSNITLPKVKIVLIPPASVVQLRKALPFDTNDHDAVMDYFGLPKD